MKQPIEAITFDFWNTIARAPAGAMSEARQRAIVDVCERCGIELEAELLTESLGEVTRSYENSWSVGRHFHPREGAELLARSLGLEGLAGERAAEAFLTVARNAPVELSADIRPSLEALVGRGIRLGIVCDVGFSGGAVLRELLDRKGLLGHFSGWAFSDEVRSRRISSSTATASCPSSSIASKIDPDSSHPLTFKPWRKRKRGIPCGVSSCWRSRSGSFSLLRM